MAESEFKLPLAGPQINEDLFCVDVAGELALLDENALTQQVKDIRTGSGSSNPGNMTVVGSRLLFTADDGIHGRELWQSDGTESGTWLAGDITGDAASSSPAFLTPVGNKIFFAAKSPAYGTELWVYSPPSQIKVELPVGSPLPAMGATVEFSAALPGTSSSLTFTIQNGGVADLTGLLPAVDGPHAGDFIITALPLSSVAMGAATTLTVSFSPTAIGLRQAILHIPSSDPEHSTFDVVLSGIGSASGDTDGDGLTDIDELTVHHSNPGSADSDNDGINDGTEVRLTALGFDPLINSSPLRDLLTLESPGLSLYTPEQMQGLNAGARLLLSDPLTGEFKLTIGLDQSEDLSNFVPFPFSAPRTTVSPEGKVEFRFTMPDNRSFFRLEVR